MSRKAVLKALAVGLFRIDGGRALQAKAARCENTRCDALRLNFATCRSPLSEARVCLDDTSLRRVNSSRIATGESSCISALNTLTRSRCATRVSILGQFSDFRAGVTCWLFLSPVTSLAAKFMIFWIFWSWPLAVAAPTHTNGKWCGEKHWPEREVSWRHWRNNAGICTESQ